MIILVRVLLYPRLLQWLTETSNGFYAFCHRTTVLILIAGRSIERIYNFEKIQLRRKKGIIMNGIAIYKTLLKYHSQPYFICDFETNNVLYCNEEMKRLLFGNLRVIGKPFFEMIQDKRDSGGSIPVLDWANGDIIQDNIFNDRLQKSFQLTYTRVQGEQQNLLIIEYKYLMAEEEKPVHFQLARHIAHCDLESANKLQALLKFLCEAYRSDCAYVHLIDHQEKSIKLHKSWLDESITDTTHYLVQDVEDIAGFDGLILWASSRSEKGIWFCEANDKESPVKLLNDIALGTFGRRNLILCAIENRKKEIIAAISVGDSDTLQVNHSLLKYITTLIEMILVEERILNKA